MSISVISLILRLILGFQSEIYDRYNAQCSGLANRFSQNVIALIFFDKTELTNVHAYISP